MSSIYVLILLIKICLTNKQTNEQDNGVIDITRPCYRNRLQNLFMPNPKFGFGIQKKKRYCAPNYIHHSNTPTILINTLYHTSPNKHKKLFV